MPRMDRNPFNIGDSEKVLFVRMHELYEKSGDVKMWAFPVSKRILGGLTY